MLLFLLAIGRNIWTSIVSFPGDGQKRPLFWGLDILTIKWATGDLPEECRFLLNTQLMFLKKEKGHDFETGSTTTSGSCSLAGSTRSHD